MLTLLLTFVLSASTYALDIGDGDAGPIEIGRHAVFFEDPSGAMTLEDVLNADAAGRFAPRPPSGESVSMGYTGSAWWLRLELRNSSPEPAHRVLEFAHSGLSYVDLYLRDTAGPIRTIATGRVRPFETRDLPSRMFAFRLDVSPDKPLVAYVRFATSGPMHLPARLWQESDYNHHVLVDSAIQAAYFGVLGAMLLFNLGLYISVRDRLYLLYIGVLAGSALTIGAQNGLTDQLLPFVSPLWSAISTNVGYSLGLSILLLFMRQMLEIPSVMPRIDRGIRLLAGLLFISPLLFAISLPFFIQPAAVVYLLTSLVMLSVSIYGAVKRQRRAFFFVAAYGVFLTAILVSVLRARGWLPNTALAMHVLQIGSVMEMMLLAFALGDRFLELRHHRDLAATQLQLAEERRLAAERSRESERRYRTITDNSREGIAVHRNGTLIYLNPAAVRMSGAASLDQLIGRSFLDFVAPDTHDLARRRAADAMNTDSVAPIMPMLFIDINGDAIAVETQAIGITFDGERAVQVALRDMTSQRRIDQELIAARRLAEEANRAKSRFLASASHDLRQPILAARLFAASMRHTKLDADQQNITDQLDLSISTLSGLLDGLLDISRLDSGAVAIKLEPLAISGIMETIEQEFAKLARLRGLRLKLWFPVRELFVHSDRNLLLRLLRNLVDNAFKYTERGGVLVAARVRGDDILFQVIDTGIGIDAAHLGLVFDEYFQVDNAERDYAKGLGLGLSIVRRSARLLGSTVGCRSHLGRGSCFEFLLARADRGAVRTEATTVARVLGGSLTGFCVAVVEDNALAREALQLALELEGARVKVWATAEAALSDPQIIDCDFYVSDLRLPGANGLEFLLEVESRSRRTIRAVIMTGDTSPERINLTANARWPVLFKPFTMSALTQSLMDQGADIH